MAEENKDTYPMPKEGWTCFFCGDLFRTPGAAKLHFGGNLLSTAACKIKSSHELGLLFELRKLEDELIRYRDEDSDIIRKFHSMRSEFAAALRRAEEESYAKGLKDGRQCRV